MSSSPTDAAGGTLVEVTMPQMGVSVAEGTIIEWRKQPGDWVEADETICDISTDKIDTEIPSPASGRVVEILVEANETVAVGTALAELDTGAAAGRAARGRGERPRGSRAAIAPDRSHVISPVVQRIAAEHGIDLSQVKGTGVGGRVRKKDLLAYIECRRATGSRAQRPAAHRVALPARRHRAVPARAATPNGEREPLSPMRRQIAEHMLRSRRTAAHVTTVAEVDMSRVVARRAAAEGAVRGARRPAHLPRVRRAGDRRRAAGAARPERVDRRRRPRLPRRRQPRHRGRARRRPDRARDPASAAAQPRGHRGGDRRPLRRAPARSSSRPRTSRAAPSRSRTPASSAPCSRRRSSTSLRSRSSTSRPS